MEPQGLLKQPVPVPRPVLPHYSASLLASYASPVPGAGKIRVSTGTADGDAGVFVKAGVACAGRVLTLAYLGLFVIGSSCSRTRRRRDVGGNGKRRQHCGGRSHAIV